MLQFDSLTPSNLYIFTTATCTSSGSFMCLWLPCLYDACLSLARCMWEWRRYTLHRIKHVMTYIYEKCSRRRRSSSELRFSSTFFTLRLPLSHIWLGTSQCWALEIHQIKIEVSFRLGKRHCSSTMTSERMAIIWIAGKKCAAIRCFWKKTNTYVIHCHDNINIVNEETFPLPYL